MCNIAGYVGSRPAAPILLDMIRNQEGLDGGFYTGIATIHEGKIHYAKLTGDLDRLLALTDAAALPGTVGIAHSRTRSGGGDEWAHPFVGKRDGEIRLAYVANGYAGCFADRKPEQEALAQALWDAGFPMSARVRDEEGRYLTLRDGYGVHMSDAMCQLILKNMTEGLDAPAAMAKAFCEMPAAIVGLALDCREPDAIAWSRINFPMMVSHADHGTYLATSALGIPEDGRDPSILPACCGGRVTAGGYTVVPYPDPPVYVDQIDAACWHKAYQVAVAALAEGPCDLTAISTRVRETVFAGSACPPNTLVAFEVLRALVREDRVTRSVTRLESDVPGIDAPRIFFELK